MGAEARSRLRPRHAAERLIPLPTQTASSLPSGAALASAEELDRCATSVCPTFQDVLARYQDAIYRYALHLTRNRVDANQLYQETVLKAYRRFDRLDGSANYRAWLYRIATNAFLSDRRKRGQEGSLDGDTAVTIAAATDAARLDDHDLLRDAEALVADLPLKQRLALVQRKYHGLSYAEIAVNLRCSEAAARASAHAALRTLRERFGDRWSG